MKRWFSLDFMPRVWTRPWVQTLVAALLGGPLAVGIVWWRGSGRFRLNHVAALLLPLVFAVVLGILLPRPYADQAVYWLMLGCASVWALAARQQALAEPFSVPRLLWMCAWVSVLNAVGLVIFSYSLYQYNLAQLRP